MLRTDCQLQLKTDSKSIRLILVFLSIFCFFGLASFSVADGWAKDITLEWDPNTEPDLGGYIVHYGTESGIYDHSLDVGNFTSAVISGLDENTQYYFAISAYNIDGLSSALSNEVSTALTPSAIYQSTSSHGGGGGGGCFINAADNRSWVRIERRLENTLRTWWQRIEDSVAEFTAVQKLKNKPPQ